MDPNRARRDGRSTTVLDVVFVGMLAVLFTAMAVGLLFFT